MATIRKIVPSGQISEFRGPAPEAGGGFRLLAQAFDTAYSVLEPKAIAEETAKGAALGRELAKQQIGGTGQVYASSSGQPAAGGSKYRDAISSIESGGRYDAVGPTNAKLGRALGKYQIMEANIGPWSREALGREVTADEFLANPGVQDAIFDHKFGGYVSQFGEEGAAQAWFAGPGGVGKTDRKDVLGTDVGSYGERFMGALGGSVSMSSSGSSPEAAAVFAPTLLKDADGKLVSRLYDPSANPIMQAHNAAALADYQSGIFLKGSADMAGMRQQFALDPDGFRQASEAYLDAIVEDAPEIFQQDIRDGLTREVQQTFLGILDEKHRDIRQRSANSNMALTEKYGDSLAVAIAGGDPAAIATARAELESSLSIRERLPGLAWTPEESANTVRKAEEAGMREVEKQQDAQISEWTRMFKVVVDAAKNGGTSAYDDLLDNPQAAAAAPDAYNEALRFRAVADSLPTLVKTPPGQATAIVDELKKTPATTDYDDELVGTMESVIADNAEKLAKDPIKRLSEIFPDDPPPPMPDLTSNPEALPEWLAARADYAQRKSDEGFMPKPIYVSAEEATALGAMFGKEVPADLKFGALSSVVAAMGPDAAGFFDQISVSDKTVRAAGMALAFGVSPKVAEDALIGRQRLDEGLIQSPEDRAVMGAFSGNMDTAMRASPATESALSEVKELAISIYAATAPVNATPAQQKEVMKTAWNRALGQTETPTGIRGGVQDIGGQPVWLSPSLSADEVSGALEAAFGATGYFTDTPADAGMWVAAASGTVPAVEGEPVTAEMWESGNMAMVPIGGNEYRLQIIYGDGSRSDVRAMGTANQFIFDAEALVKMWRLKQ